MEFPRSPGDDRVPILNEFRVLSNLIDCKNTILQAELILGIDIMNTSLFRIVQFPVNFPAADGPKRDA